MPIYMDFHVIDQVTIDVIKQAHIADKSVQNKYGVKYLQFWVNEDLGTVFCLMDGPSKEACAQVHKEAHGNMACNMTEVKPGFYELFMGNNQKLDHGLVLKPNGRVDNAHRYLLMVDVIGLTKAKNLKDINALLNVSKERDLVSKTLKKYNGSEIKNLWDDSILAVFDQDDNAVKAAIEVKNELSRTQNSNIFKISLCIGQPLTQHQGFFENALNRSQQLNLIAQKSEVIFDSNINIPIELDDLVLNKVRILENKESEFLNAFFKVIQSNISNPNFNINFLTEHLGISRPQIYRKITQLSGRSPIHFIRDIRLRKALSLISKNEFTISEIAYEVGYNSPSYFSKCFSEKYGITPSQIA